MPYDPERELFAASRCAKQLIVLSADALLDELTARLEDPASLAEELVASGVLPACYRRRYDGAFLERFHNVLELARNALVSDLPFLANSTEELAAHAIFAQAQRILAAAGTGWEERAAAIDPGLPCQLAQKSAHLAEEIDALFAATIQDGDVLGLFDVPADQDPEEHVSPPDGPRGWALLRFENWLVPFGGAPRPHITYDARAWPAEA